MAITLTQKQADALERLKTAIVPDELFGMQCVAILEAMKNGYEIKSEFQVGDWAKDKIQTDEIGKITQAQGNYIRMEILKGFSVIEVGRSSNSLTDVTIEEIGEEQERRKWAKIGRQPGEFEAEDVIQLIGGKIVKIRTGVTHKDGEIHAEAARCLYEKGQVLSVYPVQSMVEL